MSNHELHKAVGEAFNTISKSLVGYKVELDEACEVNINSKKHLPFFLSVNAHNDTEITNVDLMIVHENKSVKVICEIEESDVTPIRTFGKVFTAASAIMCKLNDGTKYDVDKNGIFIQVLSSKGLKDHSKKIQQGKNIETAINDILKSNGSWIKEYYLIYGVKDDFSPGGSGYDEIKEKLNKIGEKNSLINH